MVWMGRGKAVLYPPTVYILWWYFCKQSKKWNRHNFLPLYTCQFGCWPCSSPLQYPLPLNIRYCITEKLENLTEKMMWVHSTLHGKNCNVAGFYSIVDCILLGSLVMILYIMKIFIKWVLSFCGNNPMQSEIAAHIGLAGKCFCHICEVWERTSPMCHLLCDL